MRKDKLLAVWEIVRWLDEARWNEEETKHILIPGTVFENLDEGQKIIVHWLAYVTDQQRPYQDVWMKGGPIFAEIINKYCNKPGSIFTLLESYTSRSAKSGGVDIFKSKTQLIDGLPIEYTPRFGMHILSIARTLYLLEPFKLNLVKYLSEHWDFAGKPENNSEGDNCISRIAFLLYLLSYHSIEKGIVSLHNNGEEIRKHINKYSEWLGNLFSDEERLYDYFNKWSRKDRYHKRLWAALRDYLKPKSCFQKYFRKSLGNIGNIAFKTFLENKGEEILESLELPGDLWNLRFFEKMFHEDIASPEDLRGEYERLKKLHRLSTRFYPEQFDVSFSFSQYMCDEIMEDYCPFRANSQIRKFCIRTIGIPKTGNLCPVAMITCGFRYYCKPEDCPIKDGIEEHLCPGCTIKIKNV